MSGLELFNFDSKGRRECEVTDAGPQETVLKLLFIKKFKKKKKLQYLTRENSNET